MQIEKILIGSKKNSAIDSGAGQLFRIGLACHSGLDDSHNIGALPAEAADDPVVNVFVSVKPDHCFD